MKPQSTASALDRTLVITPAIDQHYRFLSHAQRQAVATTDGPLDDLTALGVESGTARELTGAYGSDQGHTWAVYAEQAQGLNNPAGSVVAKLRAGEPAPAPGGDHHRDAQPDVPTVLSPSPRKGAAEQYGIEPEVMGIWDQTQPELQRQMAKATYDQRLRGSYLLRLKDGQAVIGVTAPYAADWLDGRLRPTIARTLGKEDIELAFEVLEKEEA